MKKLLAVGLAGAMLFALTGCGGDKKAADKPAAEKK